MAHSRARAMSVSFLLGSVVLLCLFLIGCKDKSDDYYTQGSAHYQKQDYDQALLDFTEALKIDPKHTKAYLDRGHIYFIKGDYQHAIDDFSKAIEIAPLNAQLWLSRGSAYAALNQFHSAISDYSRGIEISPNSYSIYIQRAKVHEMTGDPPKAISDYTTAIKLNPSYAHPESFLDYIDDKTEAGFSKAVALAALAKTYPRRGKLYVDAGEIEKAISDYTKSLEIHPGQAQVYAKRAIAYHRNGENDKAQTDAQKAQDLGHDLDAEFLEAMRQVSEQE